MLVMRGALKAGTLTALNGIGIGLFVGLAIMFSSIYQGKCAVTAIQASAKQPAIYGKTIAALGIVESFALFAFVFALMLL
jgi:V/A-type H+-transporting ATPase subunit K